MSYIKQQFERLGTSPQDDYRLRITSSKGTTNNININKKQLDQIRHILNGGQTPGQRPQFGVRIVSPEGRGYMSYRGKSSWCKSSARQHLTGWLAANPGGEAVLEEFPR